MSILVLVAAAILLVGGVGMAAGAATAGFGGVLLLLARDPGDAEGIVAFPALAPFLLAAAALWLVAAIAHVMATVGLLTRRRWGRTLGLIVGGVAFMLAGFDVLTRLSNRGGELGTELIILGGYGFTVAVLVVARDHFRRT